MSAATRAFLAMTGARLPIVQAPMANFAGTELAIAAIDAGGVGSLPCAVLDAEAVAAQAAAVRGAAMGPLNLNFFCHTLGPPPDETAWHQVLAPFMPRKAWHRRPRHRRCADHSTRPWPMRSARVRPEIVSFHFGLPDEDLLERVKATGALIFGCATSVAEARYLVERGCDAVIAQGFEAGGHAGHFLEGHRPVGLIALVPQIVEAVHVPVIAAGGIADEHGAVAAVALGAAAVQIGTAYLRTPEARPSAVHRKRLETATADDGVFTNLFSGGLARGLRNRLIDTIGPVNVAAPPFPYASAALAPLRAKAESQGRDDYTSLWAGQGIGLARAEPAIAVTERIGAAALSSGSLA